jgi:hypothetical protein
VIVVGGLLLAVNVVIIGGFMQRTNTEPLLPTTILELIPKPGDLVSPQSAIGVDLRADQTGVLLFDGVEIPEDELTLQPTEGVVTFAPGPDKLFLTKLPQGSHTITVIYWPRSSTRAEGTSSFSWSFKVGA